MNRLIKFRVWDKITNRYLQELGIYYWHIPYSLDGEEITGEANLFGLSELLRHNNFVAQQYTGLTDSQGNPICEGDILEWKGEFIAEVFFEKENAAFVIKSKKGGKAFMSENYVLNFQIIGNIFEHKHLLEK